VEKNVTPAACQKFARFVPEKTAADEYLPRNYRTKQKTVKILVTGTAGFIGSAVAIKLLDRGDDVIGLDNLNDYYDVNLKKARLARFKDHPRYAHVHADLSDRKAIEGMFAEHKPQRVVNLAAQAGVRYAAKNPHIYVSSNVTGFLHILEGCRHNGVEHLVFASTSSVYGANTKMPFSEHDSAEHPLTLYAATKKANEVMAHSYAHLYGLPCTGLRFFTVYGPWGRPDMALFLFTKAILAGEPIKVFNYGRHRRAFTYIDDVVEGVVRALDRLPSANQSWDAGRADPATSSAPYRLFNIGSPETVELSRYIEVLEQCLGQKAQIEMLPLQAGDVPDTEADVRDLVTEVGYQPQCTVESGVSRFVEWYRSYFRA
jgi:UDP-glucuronate 4-epimerase